MTCNNICETECIAKKHPWNPYKRGYKYCASCEIYIVWQGVFCPCCSQRLRSKPNSKPQSKLGRSLVCMMCNWRCDFSSKVKSIICGRCKQRNKTPLRAKLKCKYCKGTSIYYWQGGNTRMVCETCKKVRKTEYYQENKERFLLRAKYYYEDNKEEIKERIKLYQKNNPEKVKKWRHKQKKKIWAEHGEEISAYLKKWKKENPEKVKAAKKRHYEKYKDKLLAQSKKNYDIRKQNPEWVEKERKRNREYYHSPAGQAVEARKKEKRKTDPEYAKRRKESSLKWYHKNRDKIKANYDKHREANKDKINERNRQSYYIKQGRTPTPRKETRPRKVKKTWGRVNSCRVKLIK